MGKEVWNNQINNWNKNLFYNPNKNILLKWLLKYGKKSDRILDQGCGVGQYAFTVCKMGFKNVTGMDFSASLIAQAKNNNKKLRYKCKFVKGDIRKMPFRDKTFDSILSAGTIEHVPETDKAMQELSRVLKKGRYLIIHVPHKYSTFTILKKIQQALGIWKLGYEKSFSIPYFRKLLEKNSFKILEYKLSEFKAGKHKIIGKLIEIIDAPLYLFGLGGHHMCFFCQRIK